MSGKDAKVGKPKPAQPYTYLAKGISKIGRSAGFRKRALKVPLCCPPALLPPFLSTVSVLAPLHAHRRTVCFIPL